MTEKVWAHFFSSWNRQIVHDFTEEVGAGNSDVLPDEDCDPLQTIRCPSHAFWILGITGLVQKMASFDCRQTAAHKSRGVPVEEEGAQC